MIQDRFKFRIWDKKQKKLAYPNDNPYHNMEMVNYLLFVNNSNFEWDINNYELMQCTGLKDKNGKLIYEGDIVTYDSTDLFPHTTIKIGKITWHKSHWVISYFDKNIIYMGTNEPALQRIWLGSDDFIGSRTEVIGNMYETPELLESEEE